MQINIMLLGWRERCIELFWGWRDKYALSLAET